MKKVILVVLVVLNISALLYAQEFTFEALTVEDGLSQSSVTCIAQDEKGFLWFGTRDGLNFYDGKDFTIYRKTPFDTNSLGSNVINCILTEGMSGLYIGTEVGLQWFDRKRNAFKFVPLRNDGVAVDVRSIYLDHFGTLWAGTLNGFYAVQSNPSKSEFYVQSFFTGEATKNNSGVTLSVNTILHDKRNQLWVSSSRGVLRFPINNNNEWEIAQDLDSVLSINRISSPLFSSLFIASTGNIFGSREEQLWRFNEKESSFFPIASHQQKTKFSIKHHIGENRNGELWASAQSGILFAFETTDGSYSSREVDLPSPGTSLNLHQINFILEDNIYSDLYWVATDIGGVIKMYKRKVNFKTTLLKDIPHLEVSNPYLRHIVANDNKVWINLGSGVLMQDRQNGLQQFITDVFPDDLKPSSTSISSLSLSPSGSVFVGTRGALSEIICDETNKFTIRKHLLKQSIESDFSTVISSGLFLLAGGKQGVISVLKMGSLEEVVSFELEIPKGQTTRPEITSMCLDKESNLWVGTLKGLYLYRNFIAGYNRIPKPIYVNYNPLDTNSLVDNRITYVMQDSKDRIWICTRNGLMSATLNNENILLKRIHSSALKNKVLYGMIEDKTAFAFWLSSNQGLYRYNPSTGQIENFDFHDGLPGNEFNSYSFFQTEKGEFFFGGTKGYTSFYPEEIKPDTITAPIWIMGLTTTNNEHYNILTRESVEPLILDYTQRSFSINFIGLDYTESENVKYYYNLGGSAMLENIPLGNSQQVNFSQLDPGSYTLEIFSVNKNGSGALKSDTLQFIVEAPFWRMPWFYLLMTGFLGFIGWLLFYLRYRNKVMHLRAIDQVRKNISEDFHDELGSKLSIISMYSEFTKQQLGKDNMKAATYLDKVNDTASRLYENTRDLIWALNPQNDSLYDLFLQLKDFGEEMFQDTEIEFHSAGLAETWKDRNLPMRFKRHLLLIFKEGMHNALKHSGCKTVKLSIDEKDSKLIIMLQDDGIGFDATTEHKGDGLKNMAERAKHLHGGLNFISKKEGTRIWMELSNELLK